MTYVEQAAAAKVMARDILRTEMAIRVQERASAAQASLTQTVRNMVELAADFVRSDAAVAKARAENDAEIAAVGQALGTVEGLTPEEITAVSAQLAKEEADLVISRAEDDEARAKSRADQQKHAQDKIDVARAQYEKHQANLVKLEAGELKVDKEALNELTNKLIEEGRVPAGTATTAPAATGDVEEEA